MKNNSIIKNFNKVFEDKSKKIFLISIIVIIILSLLLIIARNFGSFENVRLTKNNKNIFSIEDLKVNDLNFHDSEKVISEKLGKPIKTKKYKKDIYEYKKLSYDGLTLILKENYFYYILVGAKITSSKYKINRNIKVKNKIMKVIRKFKVKNTNGTYIYGNYSVNSLNDNSINDSIYFAVRNNKEIRYVNKDAKVGGVNPNIARLTIKYKFGKVTEIDWSYDYE